MCQRMASWANDKEAVQVWENESPHTSPNTSPYTRPTTTPARRARPTQGEPPGRGQGRQAEHEPDYEPECLITLPRGARGEGTRIVCCRLGETSRERARQPGPDPHDDSDIGARPRAREQVRTPVR